MSLDYKGYYTLYKKRTEYVYSLLQERNMQSGLPNVDIGSRVFTFFLG